MMDLRLEHLLNKFLQKIYDEIRNTMKASMKTVDQYLKFLEHPRNSAIVAGFLIVYILFAMQLMPALQQLVGSLVNFLESLGGVFLGAVFLLFAAITFRKHPLISGLAIIAAFVPVLRRLLSRENFENQAVEEETDKEESKEPEMEKESQEAAAELKEPKLTPGEEPAEDNATHAPEQMEQFRNATEEEEVTQMAEPFAMQPEFTTTADPMAGLTCNDGCTLSNQQPQSTLNAPCGAVATLSPMENAQGMNCPMGYAGNEIGAAW